MADLDPKKMAIEAAHKAWEQLLEGNIAGALTPAKESLWFLERINKDNLSIEDIGTLLLPCLLFLQFYSDHQDKENQDRIFNELNELLKRVSQRGAIAMGQLSDTTYGYAETLRNLGLSFAAYIATSITLEGWGSLIGHIKKHGIENLGVNIDINNLLFNYGSVLNMMSKSLFDAKQFEDAFKHADDAIKVFQVLIDTNPDNPDIGIVANRWIANALISRGVNSGNQNKHKEAVDDFQHSVDLLKESIKDPERLKKMDESIEDIFSDLWIAYYSVLFEQNEMKDPDALKASINELTNYLKVLLSDYEERNEPWNKELAYLIGFIEYLNLDLEPDVKALLDTVKGKCPPDQTE